MVDSKEKLELSHSLGSQGQAARATEIATEAHADQTDKTGMPFVGHCHRVAAHVVGEQAKAVAYLHDVLEKSPQWDVERLRKEGFSPEIIDAVLALTRRPDETDDAFVERACATDLSTAVKRADLKDNLSQVRSMGQNGDKYKRAIELLDRLARAKRRSFVE